MTKLLWQLIKHPSGIVSLWRARKEIADLWRLLMTVEKEKKRS